MYVEDPLVWHGGMKAGWIYEFGLALTEARANIHSITLPLFLMHGDGDRLVPISASEFIRANIGSQDKQYEVRDKPDIYQERGFLQCMRSNQLI